MTPGLIPELDVSDLDRSLAVYLDVFGFRCHASRPDERFAYLVRGHVHLMLEEASGPGRRFTTALLEYPFGRGVNLQIEVADVEALYDRVQRSKLAVPVVLETRWYRQNRIELGLRQFVVADPDGYLLRFFSSLGMRSAFITAASSEVVKHPDVEIRRLGPGDVADYRAIRLESLLREPDAFGSTHAVEAARPVADFAERLATSAVFGAHAGSHIVGVAGFKRELGPRNAHKGFVWGMYVMTDWRGRGAGAALLDAIIATARNVVEQLTLHVMQGNEAAFGLYRRAGFEVYGVEPRALRSATGYADEVLMALRLPTSPPSSGENLWICS